MKLRSLLVFGLLGSVAASFASFEMMLLAGDTGIHRYDPQNNVVLGKFGQQEGTQYDVALDPTRPGEVVSISSFGAVNRYDFNSGEYRGGFSVGSFITLMNPRISVMSNGNILYTAHTFSDNRPITRIYSPTGAVIATLDQFGASYQSLDSIQTSGGKIHTLVRQENGPNFNFFLFNYSSTGVYQNFATIETASSNSGNFGHLAIMNDKLWASSGTSDTVPNGLSTFASTFTGSATDVGLSSYTGLAGATNYVGAHNGKGYMVHSFFSGGSWQNKLIVYLPSINRADTSNTVISINDQINGSAIVVAPEPGTMIALGLGLAAVVRRRKAAV